MKCVPAPSNAGGSRTWLSGSRISSVMPASSHQTSPPISYYIHVLSPNPTSPSYSSMDRSRLPSRLAILHLATRLLALLATHLLLTLALYLSTSPHTHTHTHTHPPPLLYAPLVLCLAADTAEISALITRTEDGVPRPPTWAMVVGETLVVGLSSVGWVLYKPGASFALTEEGRWGGRLWVGVAGLV
ncbi:hypothetical protein PMIN02_009798 [Paraphaeosphaeria minitans]